MDSREIKKKLRNIKSFIGVYPRDALPNVGKRPVALIANTDSKSEPGEHWIAIILLKDGRGEYFDSYGLPPLHGDFQRYMSKMCPSKWCYNTSDIQHPVSTSCGLFCIDFIRWRCKGETMEEFIMFYTYNSKFNDKLVKLNVS